MSSVAPAGGFSQPEAGGPAGPADTAVLEVAGVSVDYKTPGRPPTASWGADLAQAYTNFTAAPLNTVAPGITITLAALCVSAVGDGVRRLFVADHLREVLRTGEDIERRRLSADVEGVEPRHDPQLRSVEVCPCEVEPSRVACEALFDLLELELRAVVMLDRRFKADPDPVHFGLHGASVSLRRADSRR